MYIINNFRKWQNLNEGLFWDVIEREPVGGKNHKVKVKYLGPNSFKVKAVNDRDLVNPDGTVDPSLMDALVNFLKSHDGTDFAREYPALQNLADFYKTSFFTFNVKKENDRRQVVVFTIQQRTNFKGVTPEVKVMSDDQAATLTQAPEVKNLLAQSDQSLQQNTAEPQKTGTPAGSLKLEKPIAIADLVNQTSSSPFFKLFDSVVAALATSNLFDDKRAKELINKVADELESQKIGENSIKFIKGLLAGFGATTFVDKYGRTKEQTQITQATIDKLAALVPKAAPTAQNSSRQYYLGLDGKLLLEQVQPNSEPVKVALPPDFKMEEFIKAITAGEITTGDIQVPDGGLKYGVKGDENVKKVQQLMLDKLGEVLSDDPTYKKLKAAGATGNYLNITRDMVGLSKLGFGLKDTDPSTITAELVNKLQTDAITESYLGIDGLLYEKFDVAAAKTYYSSKTDRGKEKSVEPKTKKEESGKVAGDGYDKKKVNEITKKLFIALGGDTEDEDEVYRIFKDEITDAQLFNAVEKRWNSIWPAKSTLRSGISWDKIDFNDAAEMKNRGLIVYKGKSGLSFRGVFPEYFNDSELARLNSYLPDGVKKF